MIIFKDKDLVYVAIPMGLHAYSNKSDVDYECKDNWDAFFTDDGTNTIVAVDSASDRPIDILRYSGLFEGEINQKSLYRIKNKIDIVLDGTNADTDKLRYCIVVARDDKAYLVRSMGLCFEVSDIEVLGESRQVGKAVYENVKNIENVEERVCKYYKSISSFRGAKSFPVVLLNTGSKESKIING